MSVNSVAPERLTSRLSIRVLYGALLLLTVAGGAVVLSRYDAELDHSKRLLMEGLRARSVALDESFHVAQAATGALATEVGRRVDDSEPADVGDLLRMAYNSRGTSDIAAFLYLRDGGTTCAPAGVADCGRWLAQILDEGKVPGHDHWTEPRLEADGEWVVATAAPIHADHPMPLVAAEFRLSSLQRFTFPVHTVESAVILLDSGGNIVTDGEGGQSVGTPWRLTSPDHAPTIASARMLDEWANKVSDVGTSYVAVDRVAGPAWFLIAKVPMAVLMEEAARETSTLAIVVLAVLVLLWSGMLAIDLKVLRPARAAAEKLAETLRNLEVTFAAVSDGIALFDASQTLVAFNENFDSLLGLTKDRLHIGDGVPVSLVSHDPAAVGHGDGTRSFQFQNAGGRWVEARLRDWRFGGRSGMVAVLTDVTEAHAATERLTEAKSQAEEALAELRQAQAQLVEAEKLAALGGLVAGVAHEINTPIGVAMSAATSLTEVTRQFIRGLEQGAVRRSAFENYMATMTEAVDLVERNLGRASDLISHFKQVAIDRTTCQRRSFDLRDGITEIVATLYPALKRTTHQVVVDIPKGIRMDGYPGPLGQVITNLVTNALLHAFDERESGSIVIGARSDCSDVLLSCRDDGAGMAADVLKRVFDPFFTTKRGRGGSGLGMHIVYSLVTGLMGGEIAVDSTPGEGTEIRMKLPLRAPEAAGETTDPMMAREIEGECYVQ